MQFQVHSTGTSQDDLDSPFPIHQEKLKTVISFIAIKTRYPRRKDFRSLR